MHFRQPGQRQIGIGLGPIPKDLIILLCVLFASYTLWAFEATRGFIRLLQLTPDVWQVGFLWQIVTYPVAESFNGIWFLVVAFMVAQFGGQVFRVMGRRAFWRLLLTASVAGAVAAVVGQILVDLVGLRSPFLAQPFLMMQGAEMVLAILIAAFATFFRNATIYFFFILPMRAGWFLWLEVLLAFIGFLATKDFGGFVGLTTAVVVTYFLASGRGFGRWLRETRLRAERRILEVKLKRMQSKAKGRGGSDGPDDGNVHQGPWVN
ncbi:MAG: hypothetical protein MPN21_04905 [Thermoanaerobaculia bacterium]|nr:hypothetical protein [Thermoanaerobaculia bacterium]